MRPWPPAGPEARSRGDWQAKLDLPIRTALDPVAGVLSSWWSTPLFHDEPKLWHLVGRLAHDVIDSPAPELVAETVSGTAKDLIAALGKVAGEAVERFAMAAPQTDETLRSWAEVTSVGERALNPDRIVVGDAEFAKESRTHDPVTWEPGVNLADHGRILVPAQLVGVPHVFLPNETVWRAPVSTGGAAHTNLEDALLAGLCEVVERDAFSLAWYRQLVLEDVSHDVRRLTDPTISWYFNADARYHLHLAVYRLPTPVSIPVFMTVLWDETGYGPPVAVAAKAHLDWVKALRGAIEEVHQIRPWLRRLFSTPTEGGTTTPIDTLETRARRWFRADAVGVLRNWLQASRRGALPGGEERTTVRELVNAIVADGGTPTYVELTGRLPVTVCDVGWHAIKVIVPEYQPLNLTESYEDLAVARLDRVPHELGVEALTAPGQYQTFPHPFL